MPVQRVGDVVIFADPRNPDRPRARSTFAKWWSAAEVLAGLDHDERWGWHSLRRKFATDLKHIALVDLAALGGWKSTATILACYQQPDQRSMRRAIDERGSVEKSARMESANGEHQAVAR